MTHYKRCVHLLLRWLEVVIDSTRSALKSAAFTVRVSEVGTTHLWACMTGYTAKQTHVLKHPGAGRLRDVAPRVEGAPWRAGHLV